MIIDDVEVEALKAETQTPLKLEKLTKLKNLLIGSQEQKEIFYNQGLFEILFQMLEAEKDLEVLAEILALINCYFFDFPQAIECFRAHQNFLIKIPSLIQLAITQGDQNEYFMDNALRVIRNSLLYEIVKPKDLEGLGIVEQLSSLMTYRSRILIISKILSIICSSEAIKNEAGSCRQCLEILMEFAAQKSQLISYECFVNCISALAEISTNNKLACSYLYSQDAFIESIQNYLRHPDVFVKIKAARIFTSIGKFFKFRRDEQQQLKWVLMQMTQELPKLTENSYQIWEVCKVIRNISMSSKVKKDARNLQRIANDLLAIEKLCELVASSSSNSPFDYDEQFDVDMEDKEELPFNQTSTILRTLAALSSQEEASRKKIAENKSFLGELLKTLKAKSRESKYAACKLLVSITRSDKLVKSIILDAGEFIKELQKIFLSTDEDPKLQLISLKALGNLALDFQKHFSDIVFIKKLVQLTKNDCSEIKGAACCTLKNLTFKCPLDVKALVTQELTSQVMLQMITSEEVKVQEQGLMIYRNFLQFDDKEKQALLDEGGATLEEQLEKNLSSQTPSVVVHSVYILGSIASGNLKLKKLAFDEKYFSRCLQLLKSSDQAQVRLAVLNYLYNLVFKDCEENKIRKQLQEMQIVDLLESVKAKERNPELRGWVGRIIRRLIN